MWGWIGESVWNRGELEQTAFLGRVLVGMNAQITEDPELGDRSAPPVQWSRIGFLLSSSRIRKAATSCASVGTRLELMRRKWCSIPWSATNWRRLTLRCSCT